MELFPAIISPEDEYYTNRRLASIGIAGIALLALCAGSEAPMVKPPVATGTSGVSTTGSAPAFPDVCNKLQAFMLYKHNKSYTATINQPPACAGAPITAYYHGSRAGNLHSGETVPVTCVTRTDEGALLETSVHGIALDVLVTAEAMQAHAKAMRSMRVC